MNRTQRILSDARNACDLQAMHNRKTAEGLRQRGEPLTARAYELLEQKWLATSDELGELLEHYANHEQLANN